MVTGRKGGGGFFKQNIEADDMYIFELRSYSSFRPSAPERNSVSGYDFQLNYKEAIFEGNQRRARIISRDSFDHGVIGLLIVIKN